MAAHTATPSSSRIFIVSGPGGVGKGTIVNALVERDPQLWLSRSWTTRAQRTGERDTAYVFTDRAAFEARIAADGFLEWTDFLGNYYGTPRPEAVSGRDVVLEIEVDGARQVKLLHPEAVLIFVLPPSRDEQQRRLRGRGDAEDKVHQRLQKALDEEPVGMAIANHVVVNDDLERTVEEMMQIIGHHRVLG
ncbi:MAG: guanylate kinase [Actinomycetota bacterium]|nr:guanylate kinase [Actinomycetota bacterium]